MPTLFMLLVGCKPPGRHTEQHDVFFGIGETVRDLIPELIQFWPETGGKLHVDAWRAVTQVDGYSVKVVPANETETDSSAKLFFINLGGYKPNEFEEFHYKMITAAKDKGEAIARSKKTVFFKHTHFEGADSHIDDKYGIDVDDLYEIDDLLKKATKDKFRILVDVNKDPAPGDDIHLGYFKLSSF